MAAPRYNQLQVTKLFPIIGWFKSYTRLSFSAFGLLLFLANRLLLYSKERA
jgi:hypothetical protein